MARMRRRQRQCQSSRVEVAERSLERMIGLYTAFGVSLGMRDVPCWEWSSTPAGAAGKAFD